MLLCLINLCKFIFLYHFAENVRKFNEDVDAKNREQIKKESFAAAAAAGQSLLHVSIASSYYE